MIHIYQDSESMEKSRLASCIFFMSSSRHISICLLNITNTFSIRVLHYISSTIAPAQLSTNPTDVNTQNGSTVTLHCIANGVPFPTIDWYKDDTLINPTEKIIISTTEFNDTLVLSNLTIVEANFNHSGSYHCTAHNVLRESINANPMNASANSVSALLQVYCKYSLYN